MKKIFILLAPLILVSCAPKSTPESEALLNEIHTTQSKTKVGINYIDYSKVAQELQVKLDDFERSEKSRKIKYAGNLISTAESYISAGEKKDEEDWSPQYRWENAVWSYEYMQNCQNKNENCYSYDEKELIILEITKQKLAELNKDLNNNNNE